MYFEGSESPVPNALNENPKEKTNIIMATLEELFFCLFSIKQ